MPTVPSVKKGILSSIEESFLHVPPKNIKSMVDDLKTTESQLYTMYQSMAFEALVEVVYETNPELSVKLLQLYSQDVNVGRSTKTPRFNTLHQAIAKIVRNGTVPVIYKTNFDECIECAIESDLKCVRKITKIIGNHSAVKITFPDIEDFRMIKLHGTASRLNDQESIGELAAQYKDIAKSLPETVQRELHNDLNMYPFRFIGYGGVDFDINLALKNINRNSITDDTHIWFDRVEENGYIRDPSLATERLKEKTKNLIKAKTEYINLRDGQNAVLNWADIKNSGELAFSEDNVPSLPFTKRDSWELLGRILEYLQAPQSREVLLTASRLYDAEKKIPLELLSLNGFMHNGEYKKFVSHAFRCLLNNSLDEKQKIELLTQSSLSSTLGFLLGYFLISHFFLGLMLLRHRLSKKPYEIYHLIAKRILYHNIQRIILVLPSPIKPCLKFFSRVQYTLEKQIREKGYLRESSYTRREALKMKSHHILQKKKLSRRQDDLEEEYGSILENMSDLEIELSVMGAETGTINVLRDMAEFAGGMNDFGTAEYYAKRTKELAESIPGHEVDVEKAITILKSLHERHTTGHRN